MEKKTSLYECHVEAGGKIVPFAGYLLPVQYQETGVIKEHLAVRNEAGLFDVSHMGEVLYEGKDATANIQKLLTNDFSKMPIGRVRYSLMCNDQGGVLDDLLVYKMGEEKYLLVVNAGNREKDIQWMQEHLFGEVHFEDVSDSYGQIALQGPASREIIKKLTEAAMIPEKYYTFTDNAVVAGVSCIISRTGYTGSFGYELYCSSEKAPELWRALLAAGEEFGLVPCGLGARDTLRLETAMPLYGHEMDETITPFETGLNFGIKMGKDDFIGKSALVGKEAPSVTRVGIELTGRGIAREHVEVYLKDGDKIGETTSGTYCPFIEKAVAMAIVDKDHSAVGTEIELAVRNRRIPAKIVKMPFYSA
ncbi:glycine cleavage system aminomethyltransferase GcvT [Enterococcus sp. CWB-B31]|uniref:glycine cleavage system aminomethyltransferase GcvT n=1 Tax=Enterococcus sp. CWB-B31 TaxID=2885159 RepID=UPI001E4FA01A|nr:glycine cleavage system aminomethyltransferase GcvT [Enterococcus sp. CWB-B31]MCB5955262.1 glycine cleavage system aminomethyltransferase GcvT [Enterococcus sp. CWB-B31]